VATKPQYQAFNYLDGIDSHGSQLSILYIRVPWAAHTERPRHVPYIIGSM
jgi:hypothetical protein